MQMRVTEFSERLSALRSELDKFQTTSEMQTSEIDRLNT